EKLVQAFFAKKLSTEQIVITLCIYQAILAIFSHLKGSFLKKRAFLPELRSSNLMQLKQMIFAQRAISLRPAV
ncbi:hypothetical protein, partial [Vibrio parahaemolyticus]|uniref:hypothetical protein n=1 Tax=Vibrio parahaemolyticus TaxID=670 RepID=UPI001E58C859